MTPTTMPAPTATSGATSAPGDAPDDPGMAPAALPAPCAPCGGEPPTFLLAYPDELAALTELADEAPALAYVLGHLVAEQRRQGATLDAVEPAVEALTRLGAEVQEKGISGLMGALMGSLRQ